LITLWHFFQGIQWLSEFRVVALERDPKLFRMSAPMFRHEILKYRIKLDMEVVSITGHEDLRMLKRYTHIKPESLVARLR